MMLWQGLVISLLRITRTVCQLVGFILEHEISSKKKQVL